VAWNPERVMNIELRHGLPCISAEIEYRGQQATIENVLLDTGSAGGD
jgi:hypothetical protein